MGYYKRKIAGVSYSPTGDSVKTFLEDFLSPLFQNLGLSPQFVTSSVGSGIRPTIVFDNFCITIYRFHDTDYLYGFQVSKNDESYAYDQYINGDSAWQLYKNIGGAHHGFVNSSDMTVTCHAAVGKNNQVISLGLSPHKDDPPYFMVTIVKDGDDSCFAIQHTVVPQATGIWPDVIRDVYIKSETNYKFMSPTTKGWYYSDSPIQLVPAINPWTSEIIPDLYITSMRPDNTLPIRNQISVNGRTFISGKVSEPSDSLLHHAMATFVEI